MASVRSVMPEPNDPLILLKPLRPLSIVAPSTVLVVPLWPRLEAEAAATACGWATTLFGGATPVLVTGVVEVGGWADTLLVGAVPMLDTGAVEVGGWVGAASCKTGSCTDMMAAVLHWR